jgi:hypothetical protein
VGVGRTIKGYLFWTHERGSFHYDVMVTLILAFIFLTPRIWNYGDHPQLPKESRDAILVQAGPDGALVFDIPAARVQNAAGNTMQAQLGSAVEPISGSVTVDRFAPLKDGAGHVTAYRMWAHR